MRAGVSDAADKAREHAMTRTITLPREEIRPAWRAAVLAYRRELRATREDRLAWHAAYAAFREVLPDMPEAQAKHETTHAIAFAAANLTAWFWRRVYGGSPSQGAIPIRSRWP